MKDALKENASVVVELDWKESVLHDNERRAASRPPPPWALPSSMRTRALVELRLLPSWVHHACALCGACVCEHAA